MENRIEELYNLIRNHSGHGHRNIPDDLLRAFIEYEWNSGRWVAMRHVTTDELTGWISWFNLDRQSLEQVKTYKGLPGCFFHKVPLRTGNQCYLADVVVREDQPKNTFRLLWNLACERNKDAETISAHLCNRPHKDGKPHWRWYSKPNPNRRILKEATP